MEINFDKIQNLYGLDIINLVRENINDATANINYINKLFKGAFI